jgi:anti-sigma factor (TIGR02949 family)
MNCSEWQTRISAFADAELTQREMEAFRAHAADCRDCSSATLAMMEAKAAVRRAGQRYSAPPELRARVPQNLRESSYVATSLASPKVRVVNWLRWAVAAAAMILLASGLFFFANRQQRPGALSEFADLHVATLASANPVEVVSTDRHTVKPWFQGRIPFTFDLPELQGSPFTLTGGRVTYFHQEPGAHLIFADQKHLISAFVFRDTPQLAIPGKTFADRGTSFNVLTWTQDGLRYVLVSDVSAAALQQLAALLQHQ